MYSKLQATVVARCKVVSRNNAARHCSGLRLKIWTTTPCTLPRQCEVFLVSRNNQQLNEGSTGDTLTEARSRQLCLSIWCFKNEERGE
jgi:isoleucyl-tRNA synthetase